MFACIRVRPETSSGRTRIHATVLGEEPPSLRYGAPREEESMKTVDDYGDESG